MSATLFNWNLERQQPGSRRAMVMLGRIAEARPDVACLTEASEDSVRDLGGHTVSLTGASWSSRRRDDERLVVLWSREPWREVAPGGPLTDSGACLSAVTETPLGALRLIGICAPHHAASPVGRTDRAPMWSEQVAFWRGLEMVLRGADVATPTVVVGDFNQFVPRIWGSKAASAAMFSALECLEIVTMGIIAGVGEPTIDHVACSRGLAAMEVRGVSRFAEDGSALSDHFGVVVRLDRPGG